MKKINLHEFRDTKRAAGSIQIEGDNGKTWTIDPPELWPDEAQELAANKDNVGLVTMLLGGAEQYAEFKAAGGNAALVAMIIQETHGASAGE
jgi:hypothetical protein